MFVPLWCPFPCKWVAPVTCFHPYKGKGDKDVISVMMFHKIIMPALQRDSLPGRLWGSTWSCWEDPQGKELRVVSGWQPPGKWGLRSDNLPETEYSRQPCEQGGGSFPTHAPDETIAPGIILITALQQTQLSCAWTPDLQKRWHNRCVLF